MVTLAERYQGGRFNSPNDVVVRPDDSIWFTDPPYGILPGTEEGHASEMGAGWLPRLPPQPCQRRDCARHRRHGQTETASPSRRTGNAYL